MTSSFTPLPSSFSSSSPLRLSSIRFLLLLLSILALSALLSLLLAHSSARSLTSFSVPSLTALQRKPKAPFFDDLSEVLLSPPLFPLLLSNGVSLWNDGVLTKEDLHLHNGSFHQVVKNYSDSLQKRLSPSRLHFYEFREKSSTMKQRKERFRSSSLAFITNVTQPEGYSLTIWNNVCLTYSSHTKMELVLVGSSDHVRFIREELMANPKHREMHRVPPRWKNDQGTIRAQMTPDDEWLYVPSVPEDGLGRVEDVDENHSADFKKWSRMFSRTEDKTPKPAAIFHQFAWDFNVGHQFHQQIWPMFNALHAHELRQSPLIQALMIDASCAAPESPFGIRYTSWQPIIRFFARIVLSGAESRVRVMRQTCREEPVQGVCFERLVLNDPADQYLEYGLPGQSFAAFRAFRDLIMSTLRLDGSAQARTKSPLRITIYSRQDSSRRRILNVEQLRQALAPYHIVRHIHEFGKRPPEEQLALYANTDLLIAPHGAHMTFTFVMPLNAMVYETFAHEEGKFTWTQNFLQATGKRHEVATGIAHSEGIPITNGFRHMDRDFEVNMTAFCLKLRYWQVPINYNC